MTMKDQRALEAYRRKRNFDQTAEPSGSRRTRKGDTGRLFVMQKHAATRLHYDLRLELDGVLKSWAVTRGPSLVPGDKRLAVEVEDHPLDYATFEGVIPEGNYGAGEVIIWDRGTWQAEGDPHAGLAKGHLSFTIEGEKLHGGWHLVRLPHRGREKRTNWLLIKAHDEAAREAGEPEITEELPLSVQSGRGIEQIADPDHAPKPAPKGRRKTAAAPAVSNAVPDAKVKSKTRAAAKVAPVARATRSADPKGPGTVPAVTAPPAARPRAPRSRGAAAGKRVPAKEDDAGRSPMPDFVEPCLARLEVEPPEGARWAHEIKFDGYRIQARIDRGRIRLRTRSGLDWTDKFARASFLAELGRLPVTTALVDGEVVVESASGVSDFSALQADLAENKTDRFVFHVFDLLHLDGRDLRSEPLSARKDLLAGRMADVAPGGSLRYSEHVGEGGEALLRHACRLGLEGIVSKRLDAPYRSGRGGDWIKSKCAQRQEFVVAGFAASTVDRRAVGALVLGLYEAGKLVPAGRVGSGIAVNQGRALWDELDALRVAEPPFAEMPSADIRRGARWVRPVLVAEVEFRGWTGGRSLRHPVFRGLRRDKRAAEVVREAADVVPPPARKPAESQTRLTHADRVFWPEDGITKQGLADFYVEIWPWIGPHLVDRPLSLLRCPGGTGEACFFQKHAWQGIDPHIRRWTDSRGEEMLVIDDLDGLVALVQAGVLEIHPWGSRRETLEQPDVLTFDLDPGDNVPWARVIAAARDVRAELELRGLRSFVKTTGGKGLHVVVPLRPKAEWEEAKAFCLDLAAGMERRDPGLYTAALAKAARPGRIFVDYLRNGRGATAVGAYSTRARAHAPVSTPLSWDELDSIPSANHFRLGNLLSRLDNLSGYPWAGYAEERQELPGKGAPRRKARTPR
jgi:bifunctional non-homologous end joining protein LigD